MNDVEVISCSAL